MNRFKSQNQNKGKLPLFVQVYDVLYRDIMDGKYDIGEKLPGENELASQLKVSRSTLRQALMFLQEDGLIGKNQGKGNFVLHSPNEKHQGIETLANNVVDYCHYPITDVQHKIAFLPPEQELKEELHIDSSDLVAVLESYFYIEETIAALDVLHIPYHILAEHGLDLDDAKNVYMFYTNFVQEREFTSNAEIAVVNAPTSIAEKMKISGDVPLMAITENMKSGGRVLIKRQSYLLPSYFRLPLQRKNDWMGSPAF